MANLLEALPLRWRKFVLATGLATLVATHNMELASRMDRRVTLREGRVVELT